MWSDYVDFFGFSGLFTLNLSISDNNAGTIVLNSIKADSFPWTGQYFQNVPISLTALPKPGFRFVRWEGASTAQESNVVINTDEVCDLKAVFESDPGSVSQVGINEIMYNDAEELGSSDWIELVNNGGAAADISGWVLKNEKPFTSFPIPQGTVIAPGQYMVVSKDSTAFRQVYRASATGNLGFDLSEDRDIVRLIDRYGNLIDEVRYFDHYPWPSKADGAGSSIELQAGADASQPASWCACAAGGTPLAVNCVAPADGPKTIVITEINYKDSPNAKTGDWFELLNNGTEIVDLSGWYVQDKAGNMMVFTSGTSLMPGEYLVLANDPLNFKIAYPQVQNVAACSVKLGSDEEMILLWDDTGALVDSVAYTSRAPWPTSASGTGYTLVLKDDLSDNSFPINWTTGVRLGTPGAADSSIRSSIDTQATLHAVTVYPNPAREILQVIAPIGTSIVISTMLGLPVLQLAKTKSTFTQISISKLSTGTYRISYSSEYSSGSIIIAKY